MRIRRIDIWLAVVWGAVLLGTTQAVPPLRVGFDPAWPPFSSLDRDDNPEGIDIDLITRLAEHMDREIEFVTAGAWPEVWQLFLEGQLDLCLGTAKDPDRAVVAAFSEPYLSFPVALIAHEDAPFLMGLHRLRDQIIAMPVGHITTEHIKRRYPNVRIIFTESSADALAMVARGRADLAVENVATASHLIRSTGLSQLKIVGLADIAFNLRYAVQPDQVELLQELNRLIRDPARVPEVQAVLDYWIPVDPREAINWRTVRWVLIWGASALTPLILAMLWWNRRLQRALTARKRAEQALQERTDALDRAVAKLQATQEEKAAIMRMAAHDLNNPLCTILLNAEYIQAEHPAVGDRIDHIVNAAERMIRMVRNLLHYDAIEHGAGWLDIKRIEPTALVQRVTERYEIVAQDKGIALIMRDYVEAGCAIEADADALDQCVDNLLSNAFKYSPKDACIYLTMEAGDGRFRISVEDEGPGVAPEARDQLFKPYRRTTNLPTGGEASHGLGLAVVKHLVEQMAGSIRYEPAPEQGSRFILEFPVAVAQAESATV